MKGENNNAILLPPMKTPRGWHVLYQSDYKQPNVFNLNERGLFTKRPMLAKDLGVRILVSEDVKIAIQYMKLIDSVSIDEVTGEKYFFMNKNGLVYLTDDLKLDMSELETAYVDNEIRDEIITVYNEWFSTISKGAKDWETFVPEFKKSLTPVIEKGNKISQDWLIRNNTPWIEPYLPRMIHDFRHGVYERVSHVLYECYKEAGGNDTEGDLIRKINLFMRIYEIEGLTKPNGSSWRSEDEVWDCWVAFAGSQNEAIRICRTMEMVILPLKNAIAREL